MLPLLLKATYSAFLTHDPTQEGEGLNWAMRDTEEMHKDRAYYLKCVQHLAALRGDLIEKYYKILARQDEVNKYWWFVPASSPQLLLPFSPHLLKEDSSDDDFLLPSPPSLALLTHEGVVWG